MLLVREVIEYLWMWNKEIHASCAMKYNLEDKFFYCLPTMFWHEMQVTFSPQFCEQNPTPTVILKKQPLTSLVTAIENPPLQPRIMLPIFRFPKPGHLCPFYLLHLPGDQPEILFTFKNPCLNIFSSYSVKLSCLSRHISSCKTDGRWVLLSQVHEKSSLC